MDKNQIQKIRECYALLEPRVGELMELFYSRLFRDHPETRPLFSGDMEQQKRHFLAAFSLSVENLDRPDVLRVPLQRMGTRHDTYGVTPEMYPWVRDALLWAIAKTGGEAVTDELKAAWAEALDTISAVMLESPPSPESKG